jgi:hypothetical protein
MAGMGLSARVLETGMHIRGVVAVVALLTGAVSMVAVPAVADDGVPSTISLRAPAKAKIYEVVEARGSLEAKPDGVPIGDAVLDWTASCISPKAVELTSGQVTTSPDGTFSLSYQPGQCSLARLVVSWDQAPAPDHAAASADTSVPWHIGEVEVAIPENLHVGDVAYAVATYTIDGVPTEGVTLTTNVRYAGFQSPFVADGETDAAGQWTFPMPTSIADWYHAVVWASEPVPDTTSAYYEEYGPISPVRTTVTLDAGSPTVQVGDTRQLTGQVYREDGTQGGLRVGIYTDEHDGVHSGLATSVVTDEQGRYSVPLTFPREGVVTIRAHVDGDRKFNPLERRYIGADSPTVDVTSSRSPTLLHLTSDRDTYRAGDEAALDVRVEGLAVEETRDLRVESTDPYDVSEELYNGALGVDGVSLTPTMLTTSTIIVRTAQTATHAPGLDEHTYEVTEVLRAASRYASYAQGNTPRLRATNRSHRAGQRLSFEVQRWSSAGWTRIARDRSRYTGGDGTAVWQPAAVAGRHGRYRFRASFAGDELNRATKSTWIHFRVLAR